MFFYDRTSGLSGIAQFNNYFDNLSYLKELHYSVNDVTNYQIIEVRKAIQRSSSELQSSFNKTVKNVCGSLEFGFDQITNELQQVNQELSHINDGIDEINWRLNDINEGIAELHSLLDWKTDLIIEQQKIANNYLEIIVKGIVLTEEEKLNRRHNNNGNILLKNAILEGPGSLYYQKAEYQFMIAYKSDPIDFFPLKQLGVIYLNSKELRDINKAEFHFRESAANALAFSIEPSNRERLRMAAGSSFYYASYCNYILNKLDNSIGQINKAIAIAPNNLKYKFSLAKYLAANNEEFKAADILKELIQIEELYCVEILKDQDLITKKAIQVMLEVETNKLINQVDSIFLKIKRTMVKDSIWWPLVKNIEDDFNPKSYITARIAIEKLNSDIL
jgi:hypothetical protein